MSLFSCFFFFSFNNVLLFYIISSKKWKWLNGHQSAKWKMTIISESTNIFGARLNYKILVRLLSSFLTFITNCGKSKKYFDLARIAKKKQDIRFTFSLLKLQQKSILFTWIFEQLPFTSYCEFERDLISLKNASSSFIMFALSTALISITND